MTLHVDVGDVVTCLPVIQEVLRGFREDAAFRKARVGMGALVCVEAPLSASVVDEAVDLYRAARKRGLTIRSGVGCLIAACALRHDLVVLHADRDFGQLALVAPLRHRKV